MASNSESRGFIKKILQLFKTSRRKPPPRLGDQKFESEETPDAIKGGIIKELQASKKGIPEDLDILLEFINVIKAGGYKFDPAQLPQIAYGLAKLISSLPPGEFTQTNLVAPLAKFGWDSLGHPPISYLGDEFQYRSADGSCNNIRYPQIGQSGTSYAKSVKSTHLHTGALPDPGTIFDALVARKEYKPHPNKISSLMFYLVVIVIHDLFRTSHEDPNISLTSSYLDLSPLYGSNQDEQNLVRTFKDGQLKPDCFSEDRLGAFPPGVAALLLCFNRFHNYVVGQLATINEGGKFSVPNRKSIEKRLRLTMPRSTEDQIQAAVEKAYEVAVAKRDNDLFQTGRLVTCGLYINIILNDYVGTLIGIPEVNLAWFMNPYVGGGTEPLTAQATPIATGNQVSCEFNLVYRFHMIISDRDDKWTVAFMKKLFPDKDPATISLDDFMEGLYRHLATIDPDPAKRNLGELKRGADGTFDNAALIQILTDSTEDCAAAFDSGIPKVMRVIEMMGINQSRYWKTATLNEFRTFMGLPRYKTFEEINPDPEKVKALLHFYGHPDNLEFYPGIVIENIKSPIPGWIPPATLARALLSDGITLLRGDRFYTQDYSPSLLTQWGYNFVTTDPSFAGGSVMYKLLMRAFPGWYEFNSVYAMFPFSLPSKSREVLDKLGTLSLYSFDRPKPPPKPMAFISTYDACIRVLEDREHFTMGWGPGIKGLTGTEYMLSGDKPELVQQHANLHNEIIGVHGSEKAIWDFFVQITDELIKSASLGIGNYFEMDAVRNVGNIVIVNFFAKLFGFPLKNSENPTGLITEEELFETFGAIFTYLFFNGDEASGLKLKTATFDAYTQVSQLLKLNVTKVKLLGEIDKVVDDIKNPKGFLHLYGDNLIRRMLKDGNSEDDIVAQILVTCTGVANLSPQFGQLLDLYLSEEYNDDWKEIVRLSKLEDGNSLHKLKRYILEGCRLSTAAAGVTRTVVKDIVVADGDKFVRCSAGEVVFVDLDNANKEASVFPEPNVVKLDRPLDKYVVFGWGVHSCVAKEIAVISMTAMLRCFARLPNLRRSPGVQGQLKYTIMGPVRVYMQEDWSNYSPWPTTLKLQYDA